MSRTKKIWIIVAVSCIALGLILAGAAFANMNFNFSKLNNIELQTKTYDIDENFSNINISAAECTVRFYASDDGICRVECIEDTKVTHNVSVDNDTLTITRTDNRKWYEHFGFFWGEMGITVYLPEKVYRQLSVLSVSGDVFIPKDFTFDEAELFTTSGDILFEDKAKKGLKAKTVSGDLRVCNINGRAVEVNSTSGDIMVSALRIEALNVESTSGDVRISEAVVNGKISIETVSGDLQLDSCDAENLWLKSVSGDISGTLLSEKHFTTHTTSGDVHVSDSASAAQTCEVTTTSGDVSIFIKDSTK